MIRHTVIFKLKHPPGSEEERSFLSASKKLASIEGVQHFECLKQVSPGNNFDYGLSMEFDGPQTYQAYNEHPEHAAFIERFWKKDVADFMEIDYEPLP